MRRPSLLVALTLLMGCPSIGPMDADGDGVPDVDDCAPEDPTNDGRVSACDCPTVAGAPVGCLPDELFEGDDPGECADGADNDQDGLFDCDDPDCAGAPDCQPACGDGRLDEGEECDDGNTESFDGCASDCVEEHDALPGPGPSLPTGVSVEDIQELTPCFLGGPVEAAYPPLPPGDSELILIQVHLLAGGPADDPSVAPLDWVEDRLLEARGYMAESGFDLEWGGLGSIEVIEDASLWTVYAGPGAESEGSSVDALFATNPTEGVIDVYFTETVYARGDLSESWSSRTGVAAGIGGFNLEGQPTALAMSRNPKRATLTHELGHLLGLLHTHQPTFVDSADPVWAQDLIWDTPHDPGLPPDGPCENPETCPGTPECGGFEPMSENVMSYYTCRNTASLGEFTDDQISRMRCVLDTVYDGGAWTGDDDDATGDDDDATGDDDDATGDDDDATGDDDDATGDDDDATGDDDDATGDDDDATPANSPPSMPSIAAPASADVGVPTAFDVTVGTDPDGDLVLVHCTSTDSDYPGTPGATWISGVGVGGRTETPTFTWSLAGTKSLWCTTFDVPGDASGVASTAIDITAPLPDLAVGAIFAPSAADEGDTVTISGSLTNIGSATPSTPVTWRVLASSDNIVNLGDLSLGDWSTPASDLDPGDTVSISQAVSLGPLSCDDWWIGVYVDPFTTITEELETNNGNFDGTPVTISCAAPVCGDAVCEAGETCAESGCPSDCCLDYEDFDFSAGPAAVPPAWQLLPPTTRIDELLINNVGTYGTTVAQVDGDALSLDTTITSTPPGFVSQVGSVYANFEPVPASTPISLQIRYRCLVGGHDIVLTGSTGGQTTLPCGTPGAWQEAEVFAGATTLSAGRWAVTVGDGAAVSDDLQIDFLALEPWP